MTDSQPEATTLRQYTQDAISAHRFTSGRRKGYDTREVDSYLEELAEYVGWMQRELARHQATERTALDVLNNAQYVADETVATAESDAEQLRRNATQGLENARKDARATLQAARAEADRTLLSARVQAEAAIERGNARAAELEAAAMERTKEFEQVVDELRASATQSAGALRSAGSRLVEMAEHFEFEIATRSERIGDEPTERTPHPQLD